jgi:hypothetical protein
MIHTSHHEFAHILHQNVLYPTEFKNLSGAAGFTGYTATWFNISEEEAHENGYVTAYAMASADEDFVETISIMLVLGKKKYDELVSTASDAAEAVFRSKEQFVVTYFKEIWGIDFYSLQTRVNNALNSMVPPPTITEAYGFGKEFSTASVDFNNLVLLPQRASFTLMMQAAADEVAAIPQFGLTLDSFAVVLPSEGNMILRMYISQDGNTFFADFRYTETVNNDVHDYTFVDANENGDIIESAVQPVLDYFSNNQFTVSWYTDPSVSIFPRAKFTTQVSSTDYFIALLLP